MKNFLLISCLLSLLSACTKKFEEPTPPSYIKFDFNGHSYNFTNDIKEVTDGGWSAGWTLSGKSADTIGGDSFYAYTYISGQVYLLIDGKKYRSYGFDKASGEWLQSNFVVEKKYADSYNYISGNMHGDLYPSKGDTLIGPAVALTNGSYVATPN